MLNSKKKWIHYGLMIGGLVLIIINFQQILSKVDSFLSACSSVFIGLSIAYLVNLIMKRYEKFFERFHRIRFFQKAGQSLSISAAYLTVILVITALVMIVFPQITAAILEFIQAFPRWLQRTLLYLDDLAEKYPEVNQLMKKNQLSMEGSIQNIINFISDSGNRIVRDIIASLGLLTSNIIDWFIAIMISAYVISSKEQLKRQFHLLLDTYLSDRQNIVINNFLSLTKTSFENFFIGGAIEAVILGFLVWLGMIIFKFPYAAMIGVLTGVLSIIPIFGAYASGAVGFILIAAQSPMQGMMFILFIVVLQQIESNLIYPRVVGNSIGLPGLWIIVSITVMGKLYGLMGMVLGIPIAAIFYKLLSIDTRYRQKHAGELIHWTDSLVNVDQESLH